MWLKHSELYVSTSIYIFVCICIYSHLKYNTSEKYIYTPHIYIFDTSKNRWECLELTNSCIYKNMDQIHNNIEIPIQEFLKVKKNDKICSTPLN